jgi:ankyrin repeat protein
MTNTIYNENGKRLITCEFDYTRPHKIPKLIKNENSIINFKIKKIEPIYYGKRVVICEYNSLQLLGSNPNYQDSEGYTPLMYSIVHFRYDKYIISKILDKNCDVNIQNKYGTTALMFALEYNEDTFILNKILDKNCNFNIVNSQGETALMIALKYCKSAKIIHRILDKSRDINNIYGITPLMYGLKYCKFITVINRLLDKTNDINVKDLDRNTILTYALKYCKNTDIIKKIIYMIK